MKKHQSWLIARPAALYRFSVRLISRAHARRVHQRRRAAAAAEGRGAGCTHVRAHTSDGTRGGKPLTIYFIWLIRFHRRRYIARLREFNLRESACERAGPARRTTVALPSRGLRRTTKHRRNPTIYYRRKYASRSLSSRFFTLRESHCGLTSTGVDVDYYLSWRIGARGGRRK